MPATPPRPKEFGPEIPPPGFEDQRVKQWRDRPKIAARMQLIHTNGASREGSIEASKSWAERGGGNTIPHLQIDRSGRGAMLLPSDRRGIANYLAAGFSLGFETADTGYLDDPSISAFTDKQAESVAVACAYYSILHNIPLSYPTTWDGAGTASHTEPFAFPHWTNARGKACPGLKKKAQVRDLILPRAREIVTAWTNPPPAPPDDQKDDDMTPEQNARLEKIEAQVQRLSEIMVVDGAVDTNYPSMWTMTNQIRTATASTLAEGFPNQPTFGWMARTIRRLAAKAGVDSK